MGNLWAHELPAYLDKWGVRYILCKDWHKVCRSSGGFDQMLGVICHHDAIGPGAGEDTWASSIPPRFGGRRADGPVGNGSLDHDGVFHFWAAGAANTAGKGGPLVGSRGLIAQDNANRTTFNIEARNNGIGEPWTPAQIEAYPRLCVAVLDWANNHTPGPPLTVDDIWSHALAGPGWTNRKIDPAGPSPWGSVNRSGTWDMHEFRATCLAVMAGGTTPQPPNEEDDDMTIATVWSPDDTGHEFVVDDGVLQHRAFTFGAGWSGWERLGSGYVGSPSAVMQPDGKLSVTTFDAAGRVWQTVFVWGDGGGWQAPVETGALPV